MSELLRCMKPKEWGYFALSLIFIVAQIYLDLAMPDYMAEITRLVETPGSELDDVLASGGIMLLCAAGSLVATIIASFFGARIAAGLTCTLRDRMFSRTLTFSLAEVGRFSASSLITRCTNDLTQIQLVIAMGLQAVIKAPIMAIWAIAKMATKSWEWTLTSGCVIAALAALIITILVLVVPRFARIQGLIDSLNRVAKEGIAGIRDVRAYNAQAYQQRRFARVNDELTQVNLFTSRAMAVQGPAMTLAMSGLTLAIYWVGVYLISGAAPDARVGLFADMVAFSSYAMIVVQAFMMLTMTIIMLPRAFVAARRVMEVIETEPSITDGADDLMARQAPGSIRIDNVSFRYPGAASDALHDVSFAASPGQTVAIIGSTGSGKTTLLNLIARLYEATSGSVMVGGSDVRDVTQRSLRQMLGVAPQKPVLFDGTISSNVSYGQKPEGAPVVDVATALRVSQAAEFVNQLPEGAASPVVRGGANLSGGQKQRISIARAIHRNPRIYLLDDTFSALDYKTDRALRHALAEQSASATVVMVAQRIGTVMGADEIVVLDDGHVTGIGTHEQLLATCEVYQQIASSQLTEEELKHE